MKTVHPLFNAFQKRDSCVRPKTRKLQGEEHLRSTSEMGFKSEYAMWVTFVVFRSVMEERVDDGGRQRRTTDDRAQRRHQQRRPRLCWRRPFY
ncbi:hypothetical protein F3Y22_tig00110462pilonHSYRG00013 [Hibiscus syriacus]|uniref:Uncharacterized protein n=1 Tax=Hibiscus syriacus TaxID=106335 RepID=A0A6A3AGP6_HIBSY|nr:hypothetical protein F3Y22_tig00110462pilonHSYRG00013 [Hibiscus syriacus]